VRLRQLVHLPERRFRTGRPSLDELEQEHRAGLVDLEELRRVHRDPEEDDARVVGRAVSRITLVSRLRYNC